MGELKPGLYEAVIDGRLRRAIEASEVAIERDRLGPADANRHLARHFHDYLLRALETFPADERPEAQVELCNRLFAVIAEHLPDFAVADDDLVTVDLLTAVTPDSPPPRPRIPLSEAALFVNATRERRIGVELAREIASSDRIDLICPFLFWAGYAQLRRALGEYLQTGRVLRVLTSTYCGVTHQSVLDELVERGAEVRVSYETGATRLHAKAWFFQRESGFSTAYVGSSNLSKTALSSGLEWNVRLSQIENRAVLAEFEHAFENHWSDPEFELYDPEVFAERLQQERPEDRLHRVLSLEPRPYQRDILDRLDAERTLHGRHRNLVVAATGTGKTVVAALDYQRLCGTTRPTLLFVAHRKEILRQSRDTFRHAVSDGSFGELWVDGRRPTRGTHVFASVQSLAHARVSEWSPHRFDVVVVDEFHHAAVTNKTYARLLDHLKPTELVGLTATPERADGIDVLHWFDGRVAAEVRLWDAIDRGLLVPFQYFAVHDGTDLRTVAWRGGRYDRHALEGIYDGNDARAHLVFKAIAEHVANPETMRALGFCAGVRHAEDMTRAFHRAGLGAACVTGNTKRADRRQAIADLADGRICAIFTVDVFNEGVDIPSVDTVLFLRPTESATLFTQQLGRGLRRAPDKRCLTVLDFVGHARKEFRFDLRFRVLTGATRRQLKRQTEEGFPYLPAGCAIELDRVSQEIVLENLAHGVGSDRRSLVAELRRLGDVSLAEFLHEAELDLTDVYRGSRCFHDLRRAAGLPTPPPGPRDPAMTRALARLIHVDDRHRLTTWRALLDGSLAQTDDQRRLQLMLVTTLLGGSAAADPSDSMQIVRDHPSTHAELTELVNLLDARLDHGTLPFRSVPGIPLAIHATYRLNEVMSAFSDVRNGKLYAPREGVVFHAGSRCNLLFVTLTKDERDYSPTTLYRDYALSTDRFHWQSQSGTRPDDKKGRRHLQHATDDVTPLLFVRETKKDDRGETVPYVFLGPLNLLSWSGERPLDIEWRLTHPMPERVYRVARVASG